MLQEPVFALETVGLCSVSTLEQAEYADQFFAVSGAVNNRAAFNVHTSLKRAKDRKTQHNKPLLAAWLVLSSYKSRQSAGWCDSPECQQEWVLNPDP